MVVLQFAFVLVLAVPFEARKSAATFCERCSFNSEDDANVKRVMSAKVNFGMLPKNTSLRPSGPSNKASFHSPPPPPAFLAQESSNLDRLNFGMLPKYSPRLPPYGPSRRTSASPPPPPVNGLQDAPKKCIYSSPPAPPSSIRVVQFHAQIIYALRNKSLYSFC